MGNLQSLFLTLDMLDKFLKLGLPEGSTKDHPITCLMAKPLPELELPPVSTVRGGARSCDEFMKKGGKKVELLVSYGVGHNFYLNKIAIDDDPTTSEQTDKLIRGISYLVENH